jgi:hypothetical protein
MVVMAGELALEFLPALASDIWPRWSKALTLEQRLADLEVRAGPLRLCSAIRSTPAG